ncbi:MAG: hypothetical protein R3D84_07780 [Paracoccaceae bacterium]
MLRVAILAAAVSFPFATAAQGFDDVHDCDTFAAHPRDPNRWAAGVDDEEIIPGPAVKYCREAVEDYPETPRFQFQLGRALWAANRLEEGTEVFLTLEENFEYEPVYAYLGDAFQFGIGGMEVDEGLASELYAIAEASGFLEPVGELDTMADESGQTIAEYGSDGLTGDEQLAALAPQPPIPAPQKVDFSTYSQPRVLQALESGDLGALKTAGLGEAQVMGMRYSKLTVYLAGLNSQFAGEYNFKDPTCIAIYDPRAGKRLERSAMMTATGGGTVEGAAGATLGMLLGTMQQMQSGNMMGMVDQSQAIEILREEGVKDGAKLILSYGCQNPSVQRLYANLVAHVTGSNPVLSEKRAEEARAEAQRQEEETRVKAEAAAAKVEKERQASLRNNARSSCDAQFGKPNFCKCVVEKLDSTGLTEGEWVNLAGGFKTVLALSKTYPTIPSSLTTCRESTTN